MEPETRKTVELLIEGQKQTSFVDPSKATDEVNAHDLAATFLDKARECGFHVDGENGNLEMGTVKAEVTDLKGDTCDCCDAVWCDCGDCIQCGFDPKDPMPKL